MVLKIFLVMFAAACVDVAVKERYVKKKLWIRKYNCSWGRVPDFWKDMIPKDRWYRIRWAYVVNGVFCALGALWANDVRGAALYLYLGGINWEHVFYQWIRGVFERPRRFFDLTDMPQWMEGLPWNRWLARNHEKEVVTSEEILTVTVIGTGALLLVIGNW